LSSCGKIDLPLLLRQAGDCEAGYQPVKRQTASLRYAVSPTVSRRFFILHGLEADNSILIAFIDWVGQHANAFMHISTCLGIRTISASLLLSFSVASSQGASDWPQFRGPTLNDISPDTGLLKDWSAGGPRMLWEATGLGAGYSGISVSGDRIYTAGDKKDATMVVALNAADGKPVWSARLGKSDAPGEPRFEGPRSTPTVSDGLVITLGQWGDLVCHDASSGKELWRKDLTKDFGGAYPTWG